MHQKEFVQHAEPYTRVCLNSWMINISRSESDQRRTNVLPFGARFSRLCPSFVTSVSSLSFLSSCAFFRSDVKLSSPSCRSFMDFPVGFGRNTGTGSCSRTVWQRQGGTFEGSTWRFCCLTRGTNGRRDRVGRLDVSWMDVSERCLKTDIRHFSTHSFKCLYWNLNLLSTSAVLFCGCVQIWPDVAVWQRMINPN